MSGLGLGFSNPVERGGVLDVCLCLCCGSIGGVSEVLGQCLEGWGGVMYV